MVNGGFPHCQTVHSVWPWFYLNGNGLIGFQDSLGAGMQPQSLMHSNLKDNISAASHTNGDDEEVAKWTRVLPPAGKVWQASKWRLLQTCDQPSFTFRSGSLLYLCTTSPWVPLFKMSVCSTWVNLLSWEPLWSYLDCYSHTLPAEPPPCQFRGIRPCIKMGFIFELQKNGSVQALDSLARIWKEISTFKCGPAVFQLNH